MNTLARLGQFNWLDIVIVGVIILSAIISMCRGFAKELFSLVIWLLGYWLAMESYQSVANLFSSYIANPLSRNIISFVVIFLGVIIVGAILNGLFSLLINRTGLGGTDRLFGIVFGLVRGIFVIGIALLGASLTSFVEDPNWQNSQLVPHFATFLEWLKKIIPSGMDFFTPGK